MSQEGDADTAVKRKKVDLYYDDVDAAGLTKLARMELEDKPAEQHSLDDGLGAMRLRHRLPRTAWALSASGGESREWHLASYELNSSQSLPPSSASSICSHTSMSSSSLTREQYCY